VKVQPPVNHRCLKEACLPRRRSAGIGLKTLQGHTRAAPALDRPLLCSEERPVRKGQILPRGDVGTVKYLSCGRNIVQQGQNFGKASGIMALSRPYLSLRLSNLTHDLAGIATGELVGVSQLSKEAGNEM
jgi:hypothetical protein